MHRTHVEPLGRVRTRIVATVGPASEAPETLRLLAEAGVDLFRLNFSHGTHDDHAAVFRSIRAISADLDRHIAVLQDLGGPKIRLGPIAGDMVDCREGDVFTLVQESIRPDDPRELTCTYRPITDDLKPCEVVYFADGVVAMEVTDTGPGWARLSVVLPGKIRSRQGLNLPGTDLRVSALTDKDLVDLDWTARHSVDYVGLSFVRRADDVLQLRRELDARGSRARIVAKIEKPQAVQNLKEILHVADAAMVARGDLGVEMDVARVPAIQKQIIRACQEARIPVITATQMLASMESSSRPTRAEASDVFNAILDGTDAVMLSGETAIGQFAVESVGMMSRIAAAAETMLAEQDGWSPPPPATRPEWITPVTDSVVEAAGIICRHLDATLLIVATQTGRAALGIAQYRNTTPTLAVTSDESIARWMNLYWGVTPLVLPALTGHEQILEQALAWARARKLIGPGDRVVLMRGAVAGSPVHNALLVHEE